VFVNLTNNACQAMNNANGGGHLTITSELGPSTFINQGGGAESVIRVIIQDDGPGIRPDALSFIFDPFFTTKPERQGTGLGLSVCHGIVSEHGGHIWAESEPDRGATFFVELPRHHPDQTNVRLPSQLCQRPKLEPASW
jgi:signal transduction histidine kinase